MIYAVSKKIVLLSALLLLAWFSFAETNISSIWSAEWRDAGMIRENIQDFSCKMRDWTCCKGNVCMGISVNCIQWSSPVMKWCNERCAPIVECKKSNIKNNVLEKTEIKTEKESKEEERSKVKIEKIEKIEDMWSKLESVIEKTEYLNYNASRLRNYVQNLNNIKYYLNQNNLTITETKKYNKELNNTINNIKQELYNIKKTYKSQ